MWMEEKGQNASGGRGDAGRERLRERGVLFPSKKDVFRRIQLWQKEGKREEEDAADIDHDVIQLS